MKAWTVILAMVIAATLCGDEMDSALVGSDIPENYKTIIAGAPWTQEILNGDSRAAQRRALQPWIDSAPGADKTAALLLAGVLGGQEMIAVLIDHISYHDAVHGIFPAQWGLMEIGDEASPALIKTIENTSDEWALSALVYVLVGIKGDAFHQFMRDQGDRISPVARDKINAHAVTDSTTAGNGRSAPGAP
jgi:hypothetical protein